MAQISNYDATRFKVGDAYYLKGDYAVEFRAAGENLEAIIFQKESGVRLAETKNYVSWRQFKDSNGDGYEDADAFALALTAMITPAVGVDSVASDKGTITQATNITTGVTLNNLSGVITTVSSTLAADTEATFTVTNSKVTASSLVMATVQYPAASAGTPVVQVGAVSDGSFTVVLTNVNPSNALNAAVKIHFIVL